MQKEKGLLMRLSYAVDKSGQLVNHQRNGCEALGGELLICNVQDDVRSAYIMAGVNTVPICLETTVPRSVSRAEAGSAEYLAIQGAFFNKRWPSLRVAFRSQFPSLFLDRARDDS